MLVRPIVVFFTTGAGWSVDGLLECRGFFVHFDSGRIFTQSTTLNSLGESFSG